MQSFVLIIVVFFLALIIVPMIVKAHISYDFLNNMGAVSFYFFFIKIFAYRLRIKNKNLVLISDKKEKVVETEISDKQMRFLEQLTIQFKQKVIIRKMYVYSRIGTGDAYTTAMANGLFDFIIGSIFGNIKNKKKSANIKICTEPSYNEKHLTICLFGSFMITIFDIIYALILSLLIIKRSEKYERV